MLKYYINPWIVTRTYFFFQNKNESLSFIENLKTGLYYILKGAISDLWNVIHSVEDLNEVETYAIKNNMQKVLTKNKFYVGDEIEILTPNEMFTTKVLQVIDANSDEEKPFSNTNDTSWILFEKTPQDTKYALARTIGIKNERC